MRLVLDHPYPRAVVDLLRVLGHDAYALADFDWHGLDDASVLDRCATDGLVLVTNNVADFITLARQWQIEGRAHAGIVLTSDATWPRTRDGSDARARALDAALGPQGNADWLERVHWL